MPREHGGEGSLGSTRAEVEQRNQAETLLTLWPCAMPPGSQPPAIDRALTGYRLSQGKVPPLRGRD